MRMNIAKLQHTKPFMPPFCGTAGELESLVQLIGWIEARRPTAWEASEDQAVLAQIRRWIDEAGTGPGHERMPSEVNAAGADELADSDNQDLTGSVELP